MNSTNFGARHRWPLSAHRLSALLPLIAAAILLSISVANTASAATGFNIQPLRLDMSARQRSSSLELTNLTNKDIPIQIKAYSWAQKAGKDVLTPTRDIFLAPPITNVRAGSKQVIRFRLKKGADIEKEKTYRIFVEQIPPADPVLRAAMEFRIRFSVPLFVAPARYSDPAFNATAIRTKDGIKVNLENSGNIHVKVKGIAAYPRAVDIDNIKAGDALVTVGNSITDNGYALPGTSQEWFLPLAADGAEPKKDIKVAISTDYFNGSGRGRVTPTGLFWLTVDGNSVSSENP